jgi:DNA-binding beta-propeller fold protein YncE
LLGEKYVDFPNSSRNRGAEIVARVFVGYKIARMKTGQTRREFLAFAAGAISARFPRPQSSQMRITTLAGTGVQGLAANGDLADRATLDNPFGLVIGPDGALYWVEYGSHRLLRLDLRSKKISVLAGTGTKGYSGDGGAATAAQLNTPHELRFDSKGNIYIAERDNHTVRFIDMKSKTISTVAGTGERGFGGDGGPSNKAQLAQPHSIALDRTDNVYICDIMNNRVRKIDAKTRAITTFAGTGERANTPVSASLNGTPLAGPRSIDITPDGKMYLVLREGNRVFEVDVARRQLKLVAGTGEMGYSGDGGAALFAKFNGPKGIAYSPEGALYISDTENHVIRRIDLRNGMISTVVGTGQRGDGPDGDPLTCKLARPHGVFIHGRTLYIGDSENHRIRTMQL